MAYCALPNVLVVSDAALTLYPGNETVEFQLAAGSVASDVNVTVGVSVNAYGLGVVDFSIDLCTIANGALCPLPTYQFNGELRRRAIASARALQTNQNLTAYSSLDRRRHLSDTRTVSVQGPFYCVHFARSRSRRDAVAHELNHRRGR